jgi:cellulose synthase (UDP-forming)
MTMAFYFEKFEHRKPEPPLPYSPTLELIWQFLLTIALVVGGWYISWRWTDSLNFNALWYAIPLVVAETGAYIGLLLFAFNLWKVKDYPKQLPPRYISECVSHKEDNRLIVVDVFFPTFNEEIELVKLSLRDAKKIVYPHPIDLRIHILDDGKRPEMKKVAEEEGVGYFTRSSNIGFKAGNMRNAMEQTSGDFILICDADTRPFPTILEHTLGYFKDPDVAWVQTPQWFFDIPEGVPLPKLLKKWLGRPGTLLGPAVEKVIGPVKVASDPFVNDPKMFYDLIQRRRNWANASFCCGAGSIHRRDAVMEAALKSYSEQIEKKTEGQIKQLKRLTGESNPDMIVKEMMAQGLALDEELTPYKFHVSEDIYTSIILHSDKTRNWKSVLHPEVESKMLSPQDLLSWTIQRFKYAGGTLDIALHDNLIFRPGLTWPQRIMYLTTVWSYLGGIWNFIFLTAPLIYLFTSIAPVMAYSIDFYKHILPFLILTELAFMATYWGLASYQAKANYLSFFTINLRAIWTVMRGQKIKFPITPKDRQEGNFFHIVIPQFTVIMLTIIGLIYAWVSFLFFNSHHNLDGLIVNTFWGLNNILALSGIVFAAFWNPTDE